MDAKKQFKIDCLKKVCEEETAENRRRLARAKEIKQNLEGKLEAFQRDVLDSMDEIDQFGHVGSHESKKYSQKILGLSELVPGKQIDITISKLENEI